MFAASRVIFQQRDVIAAGIYTSKHRTDTKSSRERDASLFLLHSWSYLARNYYDYFESHGCFRGRRVPANDVGTYVYRRRRDADHNQIMDAAGLL